MGEGVPSLTVETELLSGGVRYVIGIDEVGRGAIAGPVGVGACAIDLSITSFPDGLRDSKLLSEKRRDALFPDVRGWGLASSVGFAGADEVDRLGISACLAIAGIRALRDLADDGIPLGECAVLLDGHFDWLTPGLTASMFTHADAAIEPLLSVTTRTKADRDCAAVAAASVLAKVRRDRLMIEAHDDTPDYEWVSNKGYGSAAHYAAIDRVGASDLHRRTWLRPPSLLEGLDAIA